MIFHGRSGIPLHLISIIDQDQYIERTTHQLGAKPQKYRVTVATSDALEQMIIWGNGAVRMSALGLKAAVESAGAEYFNS